MKQIKKEISELVEKAVKETLKDKNVKLKEFGAVLVEKNKEEKFGDYSTNIALLLSKEVKESPMEIGNSISHLLGKQHFFSKIEVVSPGFINFSLRNEKLYEILSYILKRKEKFGRFEPRHKKVQIEFVSANPTGPLHVGHGRGAAFGDCLANLLSVYGYKVSREYYVNNVGSQIDALGMSVKWRYLKLLGEKIDFLDEWNGSETYCGEYVKEIAMLIREKYENTCREKELSFFSCFAMEQIIKNIKDDLISFGVNFDRWFEESKLYQKREIQKIEKIFRKKEYLEEKDGAVWFKSMLFGDSKNRVIFRKNKLPTYLASDIAYHNQKFKHFNQVINVWGADHHGYIMRMKAAVQALGYAPDDLKIVLVQLVKLSRGGKQVAMSTRKGQFLTLKELLSEVGKDAARFIYMTRRNDSQLEFDLELAKKKSLDNPVYYIQYAHARLCSILQFAKNKGVNFKKADEAKFDLLIEKEELSLIKKLAEFPDLIEESALSLEPHRLTIYLRELAQLFHTFYSIHRVITDNLDLSFARTALIKGVQIVIKNALMLLGVSAPEKM